MRAIDADALIEKLDAEPEGGYYSPHDVISLLMTQPVVEERKMGKWLIKAVNTFELAYGSTGYEPVYECSICGGVEESYLRLDEPIMPDDADFPNYCPHCGSYMRGDKHETY